MYKLSLTQLTIKKRFILRKLVMISIKTIANTPVIFTSNLNHKVTKISVDFGGIHIIDRYPKTYLFRLRER